MFRNARLKSGLTIEEAAARTYISPRALINYEQNNTVPGPDVALRMSKVYKDPWLTQRYCKEYCAIGQAYSYEILNNINSDIQSVIMSLRQEVEEAINVLGELEKLTRNKNSKEDFKDDEEWQQFVKALQEWLDLEHNIECLKISLGYWCDVSELVEEHNKKCEQRGYIKKERA